MDNYKETLERMKITIKKMRDEYEGGMNWDKTDGYIEACNDIINEIEKMVWTTKKELKLQRNS